MARVFITGSSDGLGQMAARMLVSEGHQVVLHARNEARAAHAIRQVPQAETVLIADFSSIAETMALADRANELGDFDAVIHNAAVGYQEPNRIATVDGLAHVFAINSLAPYVLTARMKRPKRLIYVSSQLHRNGDTSLNDLAWQRQPWNGTQAYSDTKLHNALLACAVARHWRDVLSNSVEPGWVRTRMGGAGAPGDPDSGSRTQAWLAAGEAPETRVTGQYFYHQRAAAPLQAVLDTAIQQRYLAECARISGIALT